MAKILKEYKFFNYPNDLTSLETYVYYLREFQAIPAIPLPKIKQVFKALAEDFLNHYIDAGYFSVITFDLILSDGDLKSVRQKEPLLYDLATEAIDLAWIAKHYPTELQDYQQKLKSYIEKI